MDENFGAVLGIVILSLLITLAVAGMMLAIPVGIGAGIAYGVWYHLNGPPAKAKRLEDETNALYQKALASAPMTITQFIDEVEAAILDAKLIEVAKTLFKDEGFLPPTSPPPNLGSIEGGKYRDELNRYIAVSHSRDKSERFTERIINILRPLDYRYETGVFKASRPRSNEEIESLIMAFFEGDEFFEKLRRTLDNNYNEIGVFPSEYKGKNCPWDYLKDTPLLLLEYINVPAQWIKPDNHTLVLAGSGAGKTVLFKHLIAHLLKQDVCVIVMDSQSQLIEELAHIKLDEEDLTWISPEHPLALNPFHADEDELADEAYLNNVVSQLAFVIDKLLDAEMVPRQRTLFQHCTNLVLSIPDGNIDTYFEVLKDPYEFSKYIDKLDKTAQHFFYETLRSPIGKGKGMNYDSTRTELAYRLDALLRNPVLRRIFNTKENLFSLYEEMIDRKLILIDTSHALLGDDSATFGRFIIAQALQACYRRVKEKNTERPVVFFVDEAHEYFDEKMEMMLLQARKANVGMVIATQDLARASKAGIADSILGSTTTKIVSRVVTGDARRLAPTMKTTANYLLGLDDHAFAFASGNDPAVSIKANPYAIDAFDKRGDLEALREQMTEFYGPEEESDPDIVDEPVKSEKPTGKYGANDELKPTPRSKDKSDTKSGTNPGDDPAMTRNDNQDIEPTEEL